MSILQEILKSNSGRRLLDNYLSLMFIHGANILLPLITVPYLVRVLGIEKYGLVLFAQAFCSILYIFVEFGFNLSATRRISLVKENKKEVSDIFSAVLALKGIFLAIVLVIFCLIVLTVSRFRVEAGVYFLSFGVIFGQAIFPDWFFQGIERMRVIAVINVIAKFIFTALIFIFIKASTDYFKVPLFQSIGFVVAGILSLTYSLKLTQFTKPSWVLMKSLAQESKSLFVSNLSAKLFNSANVFILGFFAGDSLAGIYGSMEKVIVAFKSFFSPLFQAAFPWLSKKDEINQRKQIKKLAPFVFLISVVFAVGILVSAEWLLDLLFDNPELTSYATAFKMMSAIIVFASLNMLLISLYFPATGQYKLRMLIMLGVGLFNVVLATILVHFFQLYGLVISVVCTELLLLLAAFYFYHKKTKLS